MTDKPTPFVRRTRSQLPEGIVVDDFDIVYMSDIKAYLADQGLVAVPVDPTMAMFDAGSVARLNNTSYVTAIYQAMIKAAALVDNKES